MRSCERLGVKYILGLAKNSRLQALAGSVIEQAKTDFESTGQKQRQFLWLHYAAGSWDRKRLVIAKAEHSCHGENPRYVVTNLFDTPDAETCPLVSPKQVYDEIYCARGEMENRIKEQQLCLFSDRTSCSSMMANQLRLLLSTFAYVLMDGLRRLALAGTKWRRFLWPT